jgi:uncharacterized protein
MVFVDTSAWYAIVTPDDPQHQRVVEWNQVNRPHLVTTDHVIDETLTLLRARGQTARAIALGRRFFDLGEGTIHYLDRTDLRRGWELFRDQPSRAWSFTDCTSRAVIERLHIKYALAFDQHFSEFGGVVVVP